MAAGAFMHLTIFLFYSVAALVAPTLLPQPRVRYQVTFANMPHSRSAAAMVLRRDRALQRGYLQSVPRGSSFILVPSPVHQRCKRVVASLALHASHNALAGKPYHFARHATAAAPLPQDDKRIAYKVHRAANHAKHSWTASSPFGDASSLSGATRPFSLRTPSLCSSPPALPLLEVEDPLQYATSDDPPPDCWEDRLELAHVAAADSSIQGPMGAFESLVAVARDVLTQLEGTCQDRATQSKALQMLVADQRKTEELLKVFPQFPPGLSAACEARRRPSPFLRVRHTHRAHGPWSRHPGEADLGVGVILPALAV